MNLPQPFPRQNHPYLLRIRTLTIAAMSIFLLGGCGLVQKDKSSTANTSIGLKKIATLRISPTQSRVEQERMIKPLKRHLEKVLRQKVEFLIASSYKDNVDMLVDGRANAAYTGAVSYLEALERGANVKPIVAPIDKFTNRPWYRSCIIVRANSRIKTLQDLKGGKRVAFVSPSSTSGYLMPSAALKELEIYPRRDFTRVIFGGTHAKTEALLENGVVDAIATNIPSYMKRQNLGKLTPENSRVLWQSSPVPHSPLLVSRSLPPELIESIKEAFLTIPNGIEDIVETQAAGYTLVIDSDYEPIKQMRVRLQQENKEVSS
ncbi:phosphate/phosphite/phosphonate ABC transporter substrate-binding protein [Mastigocoleus testarum]|uniref:Phosphonate ABC transporter substrate-binding protein n=1 Tax=Mastigocoleus testarum BC008 TaxID=371196 RepID=A0A0V7ZP12_9CYAN|nr:phosphate/phosphite/phosphonate ABC transporter substrate-binding protein [Mastigocoleus testarum]KST66184.1 phosphonate ABC transporter substrate-binding protein [Mastigocoleus testarum BC008]